MCGSLQVLHAIYEPLDGWWTDWLYAGYDRTIGMHCGQARQHVLMPGCMPADGCI